MRRKILRLGAFVLVGVLAFGIWREYRPDPLKGRAEHRLGFSIAVPEGYFVRREADTLYLIERSGSNPPRSVEVQAVNNVRILGGSYPCQGGSRETAHGRVCYSLTKTEAASGERRLSMTTGIRFGSVFVTITAEQNSDDDPDFDFAWEVFDSLR